MGLMKVSAALGAIVATGLWAASQTNFVDASLIGGLSATAAYIIGASLRRHEPVAPDRQNWIGGPGGPPDGDDGGDGDGD